METCSFSHDGRVVAIAGRGGHVHFLDWASAASGGGQVIGSVKANGPIKSLCWVGGHDRRELMTVGQDAEVYLWDVGSRRCLRRWKDEGAFGVSALEGGPNSQYTALGLVLVFSVLFGSASHLFQSSSSTGIVNIYGTDAVAVDTTTATRPKALKTLTNLTMPISTLRFDPSSQILAMASRTTKNQLRLVSMLSLELRAAY